MFLWIPEDFVKFFEIYFRTILPQFTVSLQDTCQISLEFCWVHAIDHVAVERHAFFQNYDLKTFRSEIDGRKRAFRAGAA